MARPLARPVSLGSLVQRFGGALRAGAASGTSGGTSSGTSGADRSIASTPPPATLIDPGTIQISGLASLASAGGADLSFLASPRHGAAAAATGAAAVIVSQALAAEVNPRAACLVVDEPLAYFARVARWFEAERDADRERSPEAEHDAEHGAEHGAEHDLRSRPANAIAPTAQVSPHARLGQGVRIGANAVIEADADIGDGASIGPNCVLGQGVRLGAATVLHANVTVYRDCTLGERCIVHSGTVIGADGFGFAPEGGRWSKIPQLGAVVIGDDVEIGANCAIDRGALDDTVIGTGCKLDNLIQIAHNVRIGEHSALAGCVGVAGSAVIGRRCMIGGGAGILGHLEICDDVVVSAMSLVTGSIRRPGMYTGAFPLMPNAGWERSAAIVRRLPEMRSQLRTLLRSSGPDSPGDSPSEEEGTL